MKTNVKKALSALLFGGILVVSSGCSIGTGMKQPNNHEQGNVKPNSLVMPNKMHHGVTSDKHNLNMRSENNLAEARVSRDQIAYIAEQVPGVEHADVAMNSTEVLVGIGIDNIGKRKIIEKQVFSALQWQYPEYDYYVTSDKVLHEKITAVNVRASKGYNAQLFNQDISALARSIAHSLTNPNQ